jgi:hypothetical protein
MSEWRGIESAPKEEEILVCVTYSLGGAPPEWETMMWVDSDSDIPEFAWIRYQTCVDIPMPPTHWQPLPEPPK